VEANLFRHIMSPIKMNVRKGERVLILSDYKMDRIIYETLIEAVYFQGAIPVLVVIPPVEAFGNEPSEIVAKAAQECDLIIAVCSTSMSHTDAIRGATKKGVRHLAMGGATVESLTKGAATADYEQVLALSKKINEIMSKGKHVKVTSGEGTDIEFSIEGRTGFLLAGVLDENDGKAAFPDGEVATAPVEGTANGVIVVDGTVHHLGRLNNEIRWVVEKGRVVRMGGKREGEALTEFLRDHGDGDSYNLAEFAIGTNPKATITGNAQEAKKMLGTIHFALGDNISLGGHVYSKIHMDGMVMHPTVTIDDIEVLKDGKMLIGY
jgi:leucyl aminopeptidase (aminopeptidase T)